MSAGIMDKLRRPVTLNIGERAKARQKQQKALRGKALLGVDVGSKTTRILQGTCKSSVIEVDKYDSRVNPADVSANGKINSAYDAEMNLKKLIAQNGVSLKETITSIESTDIIKRELTIPEVSAEDELGLITYEMGQYLTIDVSSYVVQYKRLESFQEEGAAKARVFVVAMPKTIIEPYIKLFESASLTPFSMDLKSNSIEKLIKFDVEHNAKSPFRYKNLMFVDMGHTYFNIFLYRDTSHLYSRIIEIGGLAIDDLISSEMNVDFLEAERIKLDLSDRVSILDLARKFGGKNLSVTELSSNQRVLVEILGIIDKWLAEISNVIKYHTTRNRSNTIDGIYIYGGCSMFRDIDKYFEGKLGVPTNNLRKIGCVSCKNRALEKEIPNFANLLGALIIN
jgi:type IV pilus assembly protein PilM